MTFDIQLFGGHRHSSSKAATIPKTYQSAPGSVTVNTMDDAAQAAGEEIQEARRRLNGRSTDTGASLQDLNTLRRQLRSTLGGE